MRPGCFSLIVLACTSLFAAFGVIAHGQEDEPVVEEAPKQTGSPIEAQVDSEFYQDSVKPILMARCAACHGALQQNGGLRLDAIQLIRQGGDSGSAINVAQPEASEMLQRIIETDESLRMPPPDSGHPLKPEEINTIQRWITSGAKGLDEQVPKDPAEHWSFQPPRQPDPMPITPNWGSNGIDALIAHVIRREDLRVVSRADRRTQIRRLSIDLTGLPPTPAEVTAFVEDQSPNAWSDVVDRLLASPRYGQRWARHWMDVWRYSDPSGYGNEIRDGRKHTWRWRDWIVDSLNSDLPYNEMIVQMLAADEAVPLDQSAQRATGFLARNWYKFNRNVWLDNIVEHSSKAFLGLTVNCARCHDHKYDPIRQSDYYAMRAIFETHDVRDDSYNTGTPDLVRAYDAHLDRKTYRFIRGDENLPDESESLTPALPSVFVGELKPRPIELPPVAWYPALQPIATRKLRNDARAEVASALRKLADAEQAHTESKVTFERQRQERSPTKGSTQPMGLADGSKAELPVKTIYQDNFTSLDEASWSSESGMWSIDDGQLAQRDPQDVQHRLTLQQAIPRDFAATVQITITGGRMWRSVGLGFDGVNQAMKSVYISAYSGGSKAQLTLQNERGQWSYPTNASASLPIQTKQQYTLQIAVRDRLLNLMIDGQFVFAAELPDRVDEGKLSLWCFSAIAEFDNFHVRSLSSTDSLKPVDAEPTNLASRDPETQFKIAGKKLDVAQKRLSVAKLGQQELEARIQAEQAQYGLESCDAATLAQRKEIAANLTAERHRLTAVLSVEEAELKLLELRSQPTVNDKQKAEVSKAEQAVERAKQELLKVRENADANANTYRPLGPQYPRSSSGRRLSYARWIGSSKNPLTARVTVNHVWMRMTGRPLVERVFDFGLRSPDPIHRELLDWLAIDFMQSGWSLKALHRRIALSSFYRLESSGVPEVRATNSRDPDNKFLWRMHQRRMDAETVRDSLLFMSNLLDESQGGPPIDHTAGQSNPRRSLYFRQDKERQMVFLNLFDGANVNECYERKPTVMPQQALALFNSPLAARTAKSLTDRYVHAEDASFVSSIFAHILNRPPDQGEERLCREYLAGAPEKIAARRQMVLVLLNHNGFVTIR